MLGIFQRLFNCDEPASRLEFYIYLIISAILIFIPIYIVEGLWWYYPVLYIFSIIGVVIGVCASFRRGKDRGLDNEKIINCFAKISLLLFLWLVVFLCNVLLYSSINFKAPDPVHPVWFYVFPALGFIYLVVFLFPICFLKGKGNEMSDERSATFRYIKPKYPKIGEVFNRDFFVNIFNFKGVTKREGFWIYTPFVILIIALFYFVLMMLYIGIIYFLERHNVDSLITSFSSSDWWVVLCVFAFFFLSLCCRRLRDLNIKPWKVIFLLIPPVNVFMLILMIFGKSEK